MILMFYNVETGTPVFLNAGFPSKMQPINHIFFYNTLLTAQIFVYVALQIPIP